MKGVIALAVGISLLGAVVVSGALAPRAQESARTEAAAGKASTELKLETLLSAELEGVENTDIIVSRVTIPPNTSLPKHWHPGEEFAYVIEGSASLWMDGKVQATARKGSMIMVPLKRVHTAITGDESATILVFRVHEQGKPERVLVD